MVSGSRSGSFSLNIVQGSQNTVSLMDAHTLSGSFQFRQKKASNHTFPKWYESQHFKIFCILNRLHLVHVANRVLTKNFILLLNFIFFSILHQNALQKKKSLISQTKCSETIICKSKPLFEENIPHKK